VALCHVLLTWFPLNLESAWSARSEQHLFHISTVLSWWTRYLWSQGQRGGGCGSK
jgi:hypothetical protein